MSNPSVRAILPLLKVRVKDIKPESFTLFFGPEYGSPTTIRVAVKTGMLDIRDGDILTLYTEVLLAKPSTTPVQ